MIQFIRKKTPFAGPARGFTLVEVCLSLAIITVTLVPLLILMASGMLQIGTNIDKNQAANISQQVFIAARQGNFYNLSTTTGYTNYFTAEGDSVSVGNPAIVYSAVVTCSTNTVTAPTPPLVTLVIKVRKTPGGKDAPANPPIASFLGTVSCQDISGYNAKTN